ncbi:MAG: dihydrodipicolinate synthase family protein [Planctomycetota bacterium]
MVPPLAGLCPVMLTPFTDEGAVDHAALDCLIEFYLGHGATALFAVCQSSEIAQLDPGERLAATRRVVARVAGRVPVVAGISWPVARDGIAPGAGLIARTHDAGAAAVVLLASHLVAVDEPEERLRERCLALMTASGELPLGLYECPQPYLRRLSPALVGELAHSGRFHFYKDVACDSEALRSKLAAAANTPLRLFNPHVPTALAGLAAGAAGLCPCAANCYPDLFATLLRLHATGDQRTAALQNHLTVIDATVARGYPRSAKRYLQLVGLDLTTVCRTAARPLDPDIETRIAALHAHVAQLRLAFA